MIASQTALGRVGVPDDIGGVVAFLCSEDARWVNGQRLEADCQVTPAAQPNLQPVHGFGQAESHT